MIDFFIGRMTVLGRGLVFQPVLVTQTCTYNSKYITLTLQIFHQKRREKKNKNKNNLFFKKEHNNPSPPKKKTTTNKQKPTTTATKEATILANVLTCH